MASGTKFRGKGIGDSIAALASAFPDVHREIFKTHVADNVVIVELAIRGTHLENGKIKSFHCYNEASLMLQQLGVGPSSMTHTTQSDVREMEKVR